MTQVWKPRPWQPQMSDHLLNHDRCALWADMGMGKSSTVLMALEGLKLAGEEGKSLIIAPLRVARDTWPDEAAQWEQLTDLKIQPIIGTAQERTDALRNDKADVYTINYDNIPWLLEKLNGEWPFVNVIPDEARRLKGHRLAQGGRRTQALSEIAHTKTRRWWNLTGRPASNGLQDLWGQTWFLDNGYRLGRSYDAFQNRWFGFQRAKDAASGDAYVKRVVFPHAQAEIQDLLRDICLTVDPKDWFKVDEPIVRNVIVTLPKAARKHYREMEKEMFTLLEGHDVEAFAAATKTIKCLQLSGGFGYVEQSAKKWVVIHDEKIDALQSVVNEADGPVLVAYHFKANLARLLAAFPQGADLATSAGMARFKAGEADVGFGHPASMGHGVDGLQVHCHTAAFFDHWWDMDQRDQFIGRIGPTRQHQAGLKRNVFIYNIVAKGTVDEMVLERHETKRSVQDILLAALKRRNGK